ncbi:MAG: DeoR/GlpR family transcriptional regulator [Anaerolineae bacterium]|nr:DeoR/GlpR family transcriptional regulator [Anaerolineae bacterium]MCA9895767.1 DeoR/GlpR family transcriptional regulator [Anaerolineae bacterium]
MKKALRHHNILKLIQEDDSKHVLSTTDLARRFEVSEATIRRDLQELAEAGRVQRQHGGALPQQYLLQQHKGEIGLLLGSRIDKFRDPFYNLVLEGVYSKLSEYGYHCAYIKSYFDIETVEQTKELLTNAPVAGIILIGAHNSSESIQYLLEHGPRIIAITHHGASFVDLIQFDGQEGIRSVIAHLLGHGYRRFGFITGEHDSRFQGYMEAHEIHELPIEPELIVLLDTSKRDWTPQQGEKSAAQLMALDHPPDAIICASDRLAIGALHWLQRHNYRVPEDVAVTGFDNIPDSEFTVPALTTVQVHKELMGEIAVERLIRHFENPDEIPLHIIVPTQLVIRQSCGEHT